MGVAQRSGDEMPGLHVRRAASQGLFLGLPKGCRAQLGAGDVSACMLAVCGEDGLREASEGELELDVKL